MLKDGTGDEESRPGADRDGEASWIWRV